MPFFDATPFREVRFRAAAVALAALGLAGCSGSAPTTTVRGSVTFNDLPVADGTISFLPTEGTRPPVAVPFRDGRYEANAVPLGDCRVRVDAYRHPMTYPPQPLFPPTTQGNDGMVKVIPGLTHDVRLSGPDRPTRVP